MSQKLTFEQLKERAAQHPTRTSLRFEDQAAYRSAKKQGFLDTLYPPTAKVIAEPDKDRATHTRSLPSVRRHIAIIRRVLLDTVKLSDTDLRSIDAHLRSIDSVLGLEKFVARPRLDNDDRIIYVYLRRCAEECFDTSDMQRKHRRSFDDMIAKDLTKEFFSDDGINLDVIDKAEECGSIGDFKDTHRDLFNIAYQKGVLLKLFPPEEEKTQEERAQELLKLMQAKAPSSLRSIDARPVSNAIEFGEAEPEPEEWMLYSEPV